MRSSLSTLISRDVDEQMATEIRQLSTRQFSKLYEKLKTTNPRAAKRLLKLRCRYDLELFTRVFFAHYTKHPFNRFHREYFAEAQIGARKVRRVRAAPRGYAKSTIAAVVRPIHDGCYGFEKYVVFFSATDPLALAKVKDIRSELRDNDALRECFDIRFATSTPGESQFDVAIDGNPIKYEAHGRGVEVRGTRKKADRPSKLVFDDIEDSEGTESESIRAKDAAWFSDVAGKLGDESTNVEFIGTVLHPESLLKKTLENPVYDAKLYKAVESWPERQELWEAWTAIYTNLDDPARQEKARAFYEERRAEMNAGVQLLWPERESIYDIQLEIIEHGIRSFSKEKQNEPMLSDEAVFKKLHWYREVEEGFIVESSGKLIPRKEVQDAWLGALDPSTGQTKPKPGSKGDYAALGTGFHHRSTGRLFVHHAWMERRPPTDQIAQIFNQHEVYGYQKFAFETNLYRNLFSHNLIEEKKRRERTGKAPARLPFYEVENLENKLKRIHAIEPKVTHGYILFNRALSKQFLNQLQFFPKAEHDDGPDMLEMLWNIVGGSFRGKALSLDAIGSR